MGGNGQGGYIQETTYRYVGCGGDFARPRRDFTCLITTCCLLSLLFLIPLLLWLLCGEATSLPYDCALGFAQWETSWSPAQQEFCCSTMGRGCSIWGRVWCRTRRSGDGRQQWRLLRCSRRRLHTISNTSANSTANS